MSRGRKPVIGITAALAVLVVVLAGVYLSFAGTGTSGGNDTPEWTDGDVVATINGVPLMAWEWEIALAWHDIGLRASGEQAALDAEHPGGPEVAERIRDYVALAEAHGREVATFTALLLTYATYAHALDRGFDPTADELAGGVAEQYALQLQSLAEGAGLSTEQWPDPAALIGRAIGLVGEDRYWEEAVPAQTRRTLAIIALVEAEALGRDPDRNLQSYQRALARDADVRLSPALLERFTLQQVRAYLDAIEGID